MTHFARLTDENIVDMVVVAEQEFISSQVGNWVQTSYNTHGNQHPENRPLNKNFAGIGSIYVPGAGFHKPRSYPSWTLNEVTFLWEPPVAQPAGPHLWDEDTTSWVAIEIGE
mgnify:FL=1|tara:strand:+ start:1032 stop:1367 length:336 start_codon:yes stop_codon:yes gene_type:complete